MNTRLRHLQNLTDEYFLGLPINASEENQVYKEVITKTYQELTKLIARYTRTIIIRMDLIPENNNPHEIDMTRFCRSFTRMLNTKYDTQVVYQWVREYGTQQYNQGLHWHLWVGVKNTNKAQPHTQAKNIQELIGDKWAEMAGRSPRTRHSGWFYIQRKKLSLQARMEEQKLISEGGKDIMINMEILATRINNRGIALGGVIDECFYALSYLAKVKTKVRTLESKNKKVSGASNISTNHIKRPSRKLVVESQLVKVRKQLEQKIQPISINDKVAQNYSHNANERYESNLQKKKEEYIESWKRENRAEKGMPK